MGEVRSSEYIDSHVRRLTTSDIPRLNISLMVIVVVF